MAVSASKMTRRAIVERSAKLRTQFPDAPLSYLAHSLSYELDMEPADILRVLQLEADAAAGRPTPHDDRETAGRTNILRRQP